MARTLVIQLGRLGDVIQTTPLLEGLAGGGDSIDLLIVDETREALADFLGLGEIRTLSNQLKGLDDEIAAGFQRRNIPPGAPALFKQLRLPRYARVINASHAALGCWIAGQIPCDVREGGIIDGNGECLYRGDTHVYRVAMTAFREHNWFNLVDLVRCAAPRTGPSLTPRGLYVARAAGLPIAVPVGRKVALNPGASDVCRRWPPANFARLAGELGRRGLVPILVGAPSDKSACDEIAATCGVPVLNLCGQTQIRQMADLLSRTDLLVSADTGAVHVAAAVGTRVLGLYGATAYFAETAPWSEGNLILQAPLGAEMDRIPPDLALAAALNRLGELDESSLAAELASAKVTGWETCFLPVGADPLGGLTYRPLHQEPPTAARLFTRTLRHVLARRFCGDGSASLEYLGARSGFVSDSARACVGQQFTELAPHVKAAQARLDQMTRAAGRCRALARNRDVASVAAIGKLIPKLTEDMEGLKAQANRGGQVALKPLAHFLDWTFRMMPRLAPEATFAFHERQYRWAVRALEETASLVTNFLDSRR